MAEPRRTDPTADMTDDELDALFQVLATRHQPATLSGVEQQPEPPPEPVTPAPLLPSQWQGLPERAPDAPEMVARPLMPQTRQEAEEQLAANQRYRALHEVMQTGVMVAAPVGRALQLGASAVRGVGNLLARAPVTTGTVAAATGLTAAPSQAEPPDPVTEQTRKIAKAQLERDEVLAARRARQQQLDEFNKRFGDVNSRSPSARIQALQEFLASPAAGSVYGRNERGQTVRPDGVWMSRDGTSGTQQALEAYLKTIRESNKADDDKIATHDTTLRDLNRDLRGLRRDQLTREAYNRLSWPEQIVRDWGPYIGAGAGFVSGPALRWGVSSFFNRLRGNRVAEANQLLGGGGNTNLRVGRLNDFFTGGGGQAPFRIDPSAPRGFRPVRPQPPVAGLYPPGRQWTGADLAAMGVITAGAGRTGFGWWDTREELASAREAASKEASATNIERVMRAEVRMGWQNIMLMGLAGAFTGYPLSASRVRYTYPRPDTATAQAEVMALSALARQQRGGGGRGGRGGGGARRQHRVDPAAPTVPSVTRWETQGGRRSITADPGSPTGWVDQTGAPAAGPAGRRGWIRVSSATGADLADGGRSAIG